MSRLTDEQIHALLIVARSIVAGTTPAPGGATKLLARALLQASEDAARYRWLRAKARTSEDDGEFFIGVNSPLHSSRWALYDDEADAAIDSAMSAGAPR